MRTEEAMARDAPLVEWGEAPEFYVSGIGSITETDGNVRLTLFAWIRPADETRAERRVRCHIIMAVGVVEEAVRQAQEFLAPSLIMAS